MKTSQFILVLAMALPAIAAAEVADGVKAVVNDRAITFAEVEDYTRPAVEALRRQYADQPEVFKQKLNETLNDSLEQLVERQIVLHSFDVGGYKLPEALVDEMVRDRIRERFTDRITLMKTLQAQGMTFEKFRSQMREQYIETALRNQNVQREIFISPYKVQTYYAANADKFKLDDQVKLRMIVLTKPAGDDTNTLNFAREIRNKIKEGATFAEMSAIYSQQSQGSEPNWVQKSVLNKEFADGIANLGVGQTSEPIDTGNAINLLLVEDKKSAQIKPLTEVRAEIENTLRMAQHSKLQKEWIDGLKKKTFIRYF